MPTLPGRQAIRSQQARDQIVQAALAIFALKGYAAASMDDICMAAGLSKGGLYHHFSTKGAVLAGVVDRLITLDALAPPFSSAAGATLLSSGALGRVLVDVWAEASRDTGLAERLRSGAAARWQGKITDQDEHQLTEILHLGALIQETTRGEDPGASEAAARLGLSRAA